MKQQVESIRVTQEISDDKRCLEMLYKARFNNPDICLNPKCRKPFKYYAVKNRKCYQCGECGYQIYPMKGTIMKESRTPLSIWFNVIFEFLKDHRGVSANSLSVKYEITLKTALRMLRKIREQMSKELHDKLDGTIEIDETFIGGKRKLDVKNGDNGIGDKQIVFGMLQRKSKLVMIHLKQKDAKTIRPIIGNTIAKGSIIHHDNNGTYGDLKAAGYIPKLVKNKAGKEFRKGIHNNNIEAEWARLKKYLSITYVWASDEYLQLYLDEFCFRYNNRVKLKKSNEILPMVLRLVMC